MLGSFLAHGLTQEEAESEILVQMYVVLLHFPYHSNVQKSHRIRHNRNSNPRHAPLPLDQPPSSLKVPR